MTWQEYRQGFARVAPCYYYLHKINIIRGIWPVAGRQYILDFRLTGCS